MLFKKYKNAKENAKDQIWILCAQLTPRICGQNLLSGHTVCTLIIRTP